jgi:hypothetical protein
LKLWFDVNIGLLGLSAEAIAAQPKSPTGVTKTRAQAMSLVAKAKADVARMEQEQAEALKKQAWPKM